MERSQGEVCGQEDGDVDAHGDSVNSHNLEVPKRSARRRRSSQDLRTF